MDISYLGAGAVRLVGKNLNVICDPYDDGMGLGKIAAKADVVTVSGPVDQFGSIVGATILDRPGEYEVKGAMIAAVPAQLHLDEGGTRGTVYSLKLDGVNVVVTGNIAGKLSDTAVEALGKIDVLIVPVGGAGLTLDPEGAAAVVSQLEPAYVVPVHYADDKTTYAMPQAHVEEFFKAMGGAHPEPISKLRVTNKELPEETQVVYVTRSGA